jgi:reductive dehalogenase
MLYHPEFCDILLIITALLIVVFLFYAALISILEGERRAALRAAGLAIALLIIYLVPLFVPDPAAIWISCGLIGFTWLFMLILLFPTKFFEKKIKMEIPAEAINEKTVMLSRKRLEPGSERYIGYYKEFPGHQEADLHFRTKPGLLDEKSAFYDPLTFTATRATFEATTAFYPFLDGKATTDKKYVEPEKISAFILQWAKKKGAVSVGITKTFDYHWYSVIGRGEHFGEKARLPHSHAIAFTVEMDKELMDTAPHGPTVMESAWQYMNAAVIATELAIFLRRLGYNARAHIDGDYRVVCPLVARDAGLGEIGRMGLLMTPELGPRVRIGVVTTDLAMPSAERRDFSDMIEFCRICKKCAHVCPSNAIPVDDRQDISGVKRWQIKQEDCYTYWCIAGTDCGRCMSDCPFSHPNNLFHNMIRLLIRNSKVFRHFALKMDNFFYGRKPKPATVPDWLKAK